MLLDGLNQDQVSIVIPWIRGKQHTEKATNLVGRHEHLAKLFVVFEVDSPDGVALLVIPD